MPTTKSIGYQLIQKLFLKNRNFCSTDLDECFKSLNTLLPFKIHQYHTPHNGWQIPPRWDLETAYIQDLHGKTLYEVDHPLKIIGLSTSFTGIISRDELLEHLHFDHRDPEAIPYHFRQFYRPWDRTWGFCVPKLFYDSLNEDSYKVEIRTKESQGCLKVAEYTKIGRTPYGFAFVAHLDHPGMVNDDLAGVGVGIELFQKLNQLDTKFTYHLLLVPEIIGSEFYLGHNPRKKEQILEACFLEMLGSNTPLALQKSLHENSQLEKILLQLLKNGNYVFNQGPFKSIICNDEYIWEGYNIPMCSLSRFPYPEYHTHKDDLSILSNNALYESTELLYQTVLELEKLILIEKKFSGTLCLSHPDYNLYIDPGQRAFGTHAQKNIQKMRLLMDLIPAQKNIFFLQPLADYVELPQELILSFLKHWEDKQLLQII